MRLYCFVITVALLSASLLNVATMVAAPITGGTGPGGFELANGASDLHIWLRGDMGITTSGGLVTTWEDQSGYNRDVSQGTVANQPGTALRNSLGVVAFTAPDATNQDYLATPAFANAFTQGQLFIAMRSGQDSGNPFGAPHNLGPDGASKHHPWVDGVIYDNFGTTARHSTGVAAENLADWHVYNVLASTPTWTSRINGTQQFTTGANNATTGFTTNAGNANFELGREKTAYQWFGEVGDYVLYDRTLNATEQIITENHYASKYDIAINAGVDHYAGDAGPNNFDFGVFGVGNEGGTSVLNAGHDGLGIQIGSAASGDWVFAGHTNGPNGVTSSDMPGGQRWERSWFIDTTNIGTADLAFDWNDAGVGAPFDPKYNALFYREINSGLFTFLTAGNVDIANQRVDFTGVNLPSLDGYFTLGFIPVPEPSTLSLLGLGCTGLAVRRRKRKVKE